jgi:hypothetical protein
MAKLYSTIFARGLAGIVDEFVVQTCSGQSITANKALFDDERESIQSLKPDQAAVLEATAYANFARTQDVYIKRNWKPV